MKFLEYLMGAYVDRKNRLVYHHWLAFTYGLVLYFGLSILFDKHEFLNTYFVILLLLVSLCFVFYNLALFGPERQKYREIINDKWPGQYKTMFIDERIITILPFIIAIIVYIVIGLLANQLELDIKHADNLIDIPFLATIGAAIIYNYYSDEFDSFCKKNNLHLYVKDYKDYDTKEQPFLSSIVKLCLIYMCCAFITLGVTGQLNDAKHLKSQPVSTPVTTKDSSGAPRDDKRIHGDVYVDPGPSKENIDAYDYRAEEFANY